MVEDVRIVTEFESDAVLMADDLFDELQRLHLQGDLFQVDVNTSGWVDGEMVSNPHVTINGIPAESYAFTRWLKEDTDWALRIAASKSFVEAMAGQWHSALEFHRDMEEIEPLMDELAGPKGPYFSMINTEFGDQWHPDEIVQTARTMACTAFREWCQAVEDDEAIKTANEGVPFGVKVNTTAHNLSMLKIPIGTTYEELIDRTGWTPHPDDIPVLQAALGKLQNFQD